MSPQADKLFDINKSFYIKIQVKEFLQKKSNNRKVWFIHGGVDTEDREQIRALTETEKNSIDLHKFLVHMYSCSQFIAN